MQTFKDRFQRNRTNRALLLSLLDDIDDEKRKIRHRLTEISSGSGNGEVLLRGNDRIAAIAQYRSILDGLVTIRDEVKSTLADIKSVNKTLNRINTSVTTDYMAAFMVAADEILSDQL